MNHHRILSLVVAILAPWCVGAEITPPQVAFVDHYSLPILWDGREIGRRAFEPGKTVQVVRRNGGFLECREGAQTFRVPVSVTDYEQRVAMGGKTPAAVTESAPAVSPRPEPPSAPVAAPSATPPPVVPPATPAPEDAGLLASYIDSVKKFVRDKPANARFSAYGLVRQLAPSAAFRREVTRQLADPRLSAPERQRGERLKSAILCYDLGRWGDFERSISDADAIRP